MKTMPLHWRHDETKSSQSQNVIMSRLPISIATPKRILNVFAQITHAFRWGGAGARCPLNFDDGMIGHGPKREAIKFTFHRVAGK